MTTIKTDLFAGHANAVAASEKWREEFDTAPITAAPDKKAIKAEAQEQQL